MSAGGAWQRRVAGRLFATSVAKQALASIRWRAGLGAELNDLRWKVANLERTIEAVVAHVSAPLPTRGSLKAFATRADAELLESLLLRASARFGNTLRVLEWGSGLSTLHYPGWLRSRGVRVDWTALEHDRDLFRHALEAALCERGAEIVWAEDVRVPQGAAHADGVRVIVFDEGSIDPSDTSPTRLVDRRKSLDDYVGMPATLGLRFHVIIVDGRKRRRCLAEAAKLLEDGGIVLLHDAQREHYRAGLTFFRSGRRIGDELWIGAQADTDFRELVPPEAFVSGRDADAREAGAGIS